MRQIDMVLVYEPNEVTYQHYASILAFLGLTCMRAPELSAIERDIARYSCLLLDAKHLTQSSIAVIKQFLERHISAIVIMLGESRHGVTISCNNRIFYSPLPLCLSSWTATLRQAQCMTTPPRVNPSHYQQSLGGKSMSVQVVRQLIEQVAPTDASVLILGESGTGKEITAKRIHQLSQRSDAPFVAINCGAIPADLLESELFGHERGAFTGAIAARKGRFELAEGGTIFLDEIGDMPLVMQVKLLRVLQEKKFERIGSNQSIHTDVRVIAATHRQLEEAIAQGNFREDLYYRLNVFPIDIPPLRERKEDIPLLIEELLNQLRQSGRPATHLTSNTVQALCDYPWPGNIRELANLIERLSILHPGGVVDYHSLPNRFQQGTVRVAKVKPLSHGNHSSSSTLPPSLNLSDCRLDLKEYLTKTEVYIINQALDDADWVVARAANALNMRRTTLVEKMRKFGLVRSSKNIE